MPAEAKPAPEDTLRTGTAEAKPTSEDTLHAGAKPASEDTLRTGLAGEPAEQETDATQDEQPLDTLLTPMEVVSAIRSRPVAIQSASDPADDLPVPSRRFPDRQWGRYEQVKFLGSGGMGRVFKAKDPRLQRHVALKFLRDDEPEHMRRFAREAQAQASIDHPNICKVYEVGEVEGQSYIAMQYIEGKSLRAMKQELSLDAKVELMRKVAEAMHAAHRLGVIHRDLKPANIMLEPADDGSFRPYVMDFGLAHITQGAGATRTGLIEGTPSYMSPEQAQGHSSRLDRRTDVYSLGATLYDLIADRPPFEGAHTIEIIMHLIEEEPTPLRKLVPSVPEDLEAIVMKCLEKEPERRYDSARALAEDLGRYLDGEPVLARRSSLGYRALKRARKHWALLATSALALTAMLAFAGVSVHAEVRAREQTRLAQQLGRDVKDIESFLRFAYSMPPHDIALEKAAVRERMRAIESAMTEMDSLGQGPGHYALGRGHLALHEYEEALSHLERAAQAGYAEPEQEYALGQALGGLYHRRLDEALRIPDKDARDARRAELEKQYLLPALSHIRKGGPGAESPAYIEALIAFYEKRHEDAAKLAEDAVRKAPWLYEADKLAGEAYFALGGEQQDRGDDEGALRSYERAGEAYRRASDVAQSDAEIHEAAAEVWIAVMNVQINHGKDPAAAFEKGIVACDRALVIEPENANALSKKSRAHWWSGLRASATGGDPRPALQKAIAFGREAVRLNPSDAVTHDSIGNAATYIGAYEDQRGLDPRASFDLAIESFQRAIEHNPAFAWAWNDMGTTHQMKADYEARRGLDHRPTLERAIELYKRAIEVNPSYLAPYSNMGFAYATLALRDAERGKDSRALAALGIESCRKAFERNRSFAAALVNMGNAQLAVAAYELAAGLDPRPALEQALESNRRAIEINPAEIEAHQNITEAHRMAVLHALAQGADAEVALSAARAASAKMLGLDANAPRSQLLAGQVELLAARVAMAKRQDPGDSFRLAETALRRAAELNPLSPEAHEAAAELHRFSAEHRQKSKAKTEESVSPGLANADKALAINPRRPRALALRGALLLVRARSRTDRKDAAEDARLAAAAFDEALQWNPALEKELKELVAEARALRAPAGGSP